VLDCSFSGKFSRHHQSLTSQEEGQADNISKPLWYPNDIFQICSSRISEIYYKNFASWVSKNVLIR